jgi:hypothetical protein
MALLLFAVLSIILGFLLGVAHFMWKISKIQKKTRALMKEGDVLIEEYRKLDATDPALRLKEIQVRENLERTFGRLDVTYDLLN